jgi:Ca2+-binding RTX toxin-like protein
MSLAQTTPPTSNDADNVTLIAGNQFGQLFCGLDGDDTINARGAYEVRIEGNDGNDYLWGFAALSNLSGGAGNDTIEGGGLSRIDGGAGDDIIIRAEGSGFDLLPYYEFGEFVDSGLITGGDGNDLVVVNEFSDLSFREPGAYRRDTDLQGGAGQDTLDLQSHNSTDFEITATAAGFEFLLTGTTQEVRSIAVSEFETFEFADRTMNSGEVLVQLATGQIIGTAGDDTLDTNPITETVQALAGDDRVLYRGGNDTIDGGAGRDTIDFSGDGRPVQVFLEDSSFPVSNSFFSATGEAEGARSGTGTDQSRVVLDGFEAAFGSDADDILFGLSTSDLLDGGNGNDTLYGTGGADTLRGGAGTDWVNYGNSFPYPVSVSLASGTGQRNFAEGDVLSGIENVFGSPGGDNLAGDAGANYLHGGWSRTPDILSGGGGDDTLEGGTGASLDFNGTAINNIAIFSGNRDEYDITIQATPFVLFASGDHTITVAHNRGSGADGTDTLIDMGILRFADGDINLFDQSGTDGDDVLYGVFNVSVRFEQGLEGFVSMNGGAGNDIFVAGEVNNAMIGGTGRDTADFSGYNVAVTFDLEVGSAMAFAGRENDPAIVVTNLISIADARGSRFDDVFHGSAGSNRFLGLGGDDIFNGSWGGRDVYLGGAGTDHVSYASAAQAVSASLFAETGWAGQALDDEYDRIEMLSGTRFNDALTGDHGDNTLYGLDGDDLLMANGGDDLLFAGDGTDVILFGFARAAYEVVTSQNQTSVRHSSSDDLDVIYDAEILRFADGDVIL